MCLRELFKEFSTCFVIPFLWFPKIFATDRWAVPTLRGRLLDFIAVIDRQRCWPLKWRATLLLLVFIYSRFPKTAKATLATVNDVMIWSTWIQYNNWFNVKFVISIRILHFFWKIDLKTRLKIMWIPWNFEVSSLRRLKTFEISSNLSLPYQCRASNLDKQVIIRFSCICR